MVLVTQGTIANRALGQVIAPALAALGGKEDVTIIVTTGGQRVESIPVAIPSQRPHRLIPALRKHPGYRERAQQLSLEFARHDVESELLSLIEECVRETVSA